MNPNAKNVISVLLVLLFISSEMVSGTDIQSVWKRKIDSLFVIASSGEVKHRDMVQPAIDSIAAIGVDAVPVLVGKYATKSARERQTINDILKKIGSPGVPILVQSLSDPDGLVVERICGTLGEIADPAAVDGLMAVTSNARWQVREQSIGALGSIGENRAGEIIRRGFSDTVGQVRKAAAVASGKIKIAEAVAPLVAALKDDFYGARMAAAEALLLMDTELVVEAIADAMPKRDHLITSLGAYILGKLGTDRAIEVLMEHVNDNDPSLRAHVATAVIKADPEDNCGYRQQLLENESNRFTRLKIESAIYSIEYAR